MDVSGLFCSRAPGCEARTRRRDGGGAAAAGDRGRLVSSPQAGVLDRWRGCQSLDLESQGLHIAGQHQASGARQSPGQTNSVDVMAQLGRLVSLWSAPTPE